MNDSTALKSGVLTTGQIAKICKVAPRTVSKWIDSGMLEGWRIPTANRDGDRRVKAPKLEAFLQKHGMEAPIRALRSFLAGGKPYPPPLSWAEPDFATRAATPRTSLESTPPPPASPPRIDDSGFVYFVQLSHGGAIKIGFSHNPAKRIASLQCGSPDRVRCLGVMFGGRPREHQLHQMFGTLRVGGEWFEADPSLVDYIDRHTISLAALEDDDRADLPSPALPSVRSIRPA